MKQLATFLLLLLAATPVAAGKVQVVAPVRAPILHSQVAAQIDRFIADEMVKRHIAGVAVAVLTDGQIRYAKGYGFADVERRCLFGSILAF